MDISRDDLDQCRTSRWYYQFGRKTPIAKIIKLPKEFIEYLMADGIFLPRSSYSNYPPRHPSIDSDTDLSSSVSNETSDENNYPEFPDLEAEITKAIGDLGGSVFPKFTWSAPKDSTWLSSTSNMKCSTPGDIFILLKGSDFVMHDITSAYCDCVGLSEDEHSPPITDHELVLRKWFDINESMEFRVFISNRTVIMISQRDTRSYYSFLPPLVDKYRDLIVNFYKDNFTEYRLTSIVIDLYISHTHRVWLLDINPFTRTTDSLLFTWDEILEESRTIQENELKVPIFRVVKTQAEVAHRTELPYSVNMYPKEYIHATCGDDMGKIASLIYYNEQVDTDAKVN